MSKAYTMSDTKSNFGHFLFNEVVDWIEDNIEPDEMYEPEALLECLIEHHYGLLEEEFEKWREE